MPQVVSVKGAGTTPLGHPFIVLEHLEGRTLRQELDARGKRVPVLESLMYTSQVLSALAEVRRRSMVGVFTVAAAISALTGIVARLLTLHQQNPR